ncbi:hypothetical protein CXB36_04210, partial [Pseudomonas syringae pv. syringae]
IRLHFQSGKAITKEWLSTARRWFDGLGGIAGSITWGVIMLNFINTALTYRDLTKDGDFSMKDIGKVTYGLGYSFNLLMAVFVEAPWRVIKDASPVLIDGRNVGILDRSAGYWKARGNVAWGEAISGFRVSMVAIGAFGVAAATLEIFDIQDDLTGLKTNEEQIATQIKIASVGVMGLGSAAQLISGIYPSSFLTAFAMGSWFSVVLMLTGAVYLLSTMALNYFKQDSIGWWLRKCSWSNSIAYKYPTNAEGQFEEKRALFKIQLSPQIHVKSTTRDKDHYFGRDSPYSAPAQYGAGVQILFPGALRGQSVHFNVISSKRPWGVLPVEEIKSPIHEPFLDRGQFKSVDQFKTLANKPLGNAHEDFTFPLMPPAGEDVVWETWVPLEEGATYLELQIWHSDELINPGPEDIGYLFQVKLNSEGETKMDGLSTTDLEVKAASRLGSPTLEIAE